MPLSPEEAALFDTRSESVDWDDEPAPEAPKSGLIMPDCIDCGASLTPDNSSCLRDGSWKHIGCPKKAAPVASIPAAPAVVPPDAPANDPAATIEKKRGRKQAAASAPAAPSAQAPTLRDHFAAAALCAMGNSGSFVPSSSFSDQDLELIRHQTRAAYVYADAMLAARGS